MEEHDEQGAIEVLVRLSFTISARLEAHAAEAGLSIQQMRLLGILRDREPTVNELAAHMDLDKSSASGLVIRAESRGLVSRIRHEHDGRAVRVRLEPEGRALVDEASSRFERDVRQVFATLGDAERTRWVALTKRLLTAQRAEDSSSRSRELIV